MHYSKLLLPALLLLSFNSFAQKNDTKLFEKTKGKLPFPVCNMYGVSDIRCARFGKEINDPFNNISFTTDSAAEVRSVHKGKVKAVYVIGSGYAVVTSFGDYFITYYPLAKPRLKKGDTVSPGQPISRISTVENPREINILISKKTTFIDPYQWFRW